VPDYIASFSQRKSGAIAERRAGPTLFNNFIVWTKVDATFPATVNKWDRWLSNCVGDGVKEAYEEYRDEQSLVHCRKSRELGSIEFLQNPRPRNYRIAIGVLPINLLLWAKLAYSAF
jgi:hypothetical protein